MVLLYMMLLHLVCLWLEMDDQKKTSQTNKKNIIRSWPLGKLTNDWSLTNIIRVNLRPSIILGKYSLPMASEHWKPNSKCKQYHYLFFIASKLVLFLLLLLLLSLLSSLSLSSLSLLVLQSLYVTEIAFLSLLAILHW